jgi:hypothetical protein
MRLLVGEGRSVAKELSLASVQALHSPERVDGYYVALHVAKRAFLELMLLAIKFARDTDKSVDCF